MALIAMTTADAVDYVSNLDPSKVRKKVPVDENDVSKGTKTITVIGEGATVFKLKSLDVFLMGYIYDNASHLGRREGSDEVGIHTRMNQTNIECARHGIVGFTNFTDSKGGQVAFKTQTAVVNGRPYDVVSDEVMNLLGVRLIQDLASEIKRISEVSASEEKNSDGA
jgi:hypothetical protein